MLIVYPPTESVRYAVPSEPVIRPADAPEIRQIDMNKMIDLWLKKNNFFSMLHPPFPVLLFPFITESLSLITFDSS
jgi:hypothetical protein